MRRTVAGLAVAAVLAAGAGCAHRPTLPGTPAPATTAGTTVPATPTAALITVPDVVGQNAAVAADVLKKRGFTNVSFGTVDGRSAVVIPENWTVKVQSAAPGSRLRADDKIVLGCTRNGQRRLIDVGPTAGTPAAPPAG